MSIGDLPTSGAGPPTGLDAYVRSFLSCLRAAGYTEKTLEDRRRPLSAFVDWLAKRQVSIGDVDESQVAAFLRRLKRGRQVARRSLRGFLVHLRREAGGEASPPPCLDQAPGATLSAAYVDYLRNERGLTEQSVSVYLPFIRAFLAAGASSTGEVSPAAMGADDVRRFLLSRARGQCTESTRLCATSLRSFLRFLFLRGKTALDLSFAIPKVSKTRLASIPAVLSPDEVEQILQAADRPTPSGRRDHAILLLLARLGLRAGEVVTLDLGDIHWRTGEILVRRKGRFLDRLPLPADVGKALALYVQQGRGSSSSRRVFLRIQAPHVGLTGPASVGHVVRKALDRAAVPRRCRCAAHLFRHSLATRMIRHGASLPEIAEVLRHRSLSTTGIYAKVAFETLRGVARPWPSSGGDR